MKINATGQTDDIFAEALKRHLKKEATTVDQVGEKQLEERRGDLDQSPANVSPEQHLDSDLSNRTDTEKDSDDSEKGLIENRLRNQPKGKAANNQDLEGITQARLEKASKDTYPHRNPDAWERTGEKRPVNNLEEEMGEASDEKRLERLEKAEKKAQDEPERVVDKDIGKQRELKPVKAFNLKANKNAEKYAGLEEYLTYKSGSGKVWSGRMAKVRKIDEKLAALMGGSISDEDKKTILSLKGEKATLLRLATWQSSHEKSLHASKEGLPPMAMASNATFNLKQANLLKEAMPPELPGEELPQEPMSELKSWPSPAVIAQDFQIDEPAAVEALLAAKAAEGAGSDEVEAALSRANELLGGFGVEAHRDENLLDDFSNEFGDAAALYINTGDMYSPTLLYDVEKQEFLFTTLGDWRETWEQGREEESLEKPKSDDNDPWGEEEEYSSYY